MGKPNENNWPGAMQLRVFCGQWPNFRGSWDPAASNMPACDAPLMEFVRRAVAYPDKRVTAKSALSLSCFAGIEDVDAPPAKK